MADYPHFEISKRCNISAKYWPVLPKFGIMVHFRPLDPSAN